MSFFGCFVFGRLGFFGCLMNVFGHLGFFGCLMNVFGRLDFFGYLMSVFGCVGDVNNGIIPF